MFRYCVPPIYYKKSSLLVAKELCDINMNEIMMNGLYETDYTVTSFECVTAASLYACYKIQKCKSGNESVSNLVKYLVYVFFIKYRYL